MYLKLSVITINYNDAPGLRKTFESVFYQSFTDFEYIVIDGGSTDGSRDLILRNRDKITWWVSETDNGVYHAMNKGIEQASGEYLLFLNSGDCFCEEAALEKAFDIGFNESIVYCDVKNNLTGEIIVFPDQLRFSHFYHATINHQSTFIRRRLFDQYGRYNENYSIASDWEFFIKCIFLKLETTRHLKMVLVNFDFTHGISARPENLNKMIAERSEILYKHFPGFAGDYEEAEKLNLRFQLRNEHSLKVNKSIVSFIRFVKEMVRKK